MNKNIDVSIVIITWKMRELLEVCLDSILKFTNNIKYELIIIDNGSYDGTVEMIEHKFPNSILVKNSKNMGVAPARNIGLKKSRGKYVLILDADMELVENSIFELFNFMENNSECGIVGSKLVDSDYNLQYSCKRIPTLKSFLYRRLEHLSFFNNSQVLVSHMMRDWDHSQIRKVDYVIGACQFIRKKVIEEIGYYDDKIFYGPEDIDYCIRTWKVGFQVYYYPDTKIIHHEQRITKKNFFSKITLKHLLGIFYLYKKYGGKITLENE